MSSGPVLCAAMNPSGEQFYSGGLDSIIAVWNIPNADIDAYDPYGRCTRQQDALEYALGLSMDRFQCVVQSVGCSYRCCLATRLLRSKTTLVFFRSNRTIVGSEPIAAPAVHRQW